MMLLIETQLGREHFYYTWGQILRTGVLIQKKQFVIAEQLAKQCIRDTWNMSPRQNSDLMALFPLHASLEGQGKLAEAEDVTREIIARAGNRSDLWNQVPRREKAPPCVLVGATKHRRKV
jgi:hypothetical protein